MTILKTKTLHTCFKKWKLCENSWEKNNFQCNCSFATRKASYLSYGSKCLKDRHKLLRKCWLTTLVYLAEYVVTLRNHNDFNNILSSPFFFFNLCLFLLFILVISIYSSHLLIIALLWFNLDILGLKYEKQTLLRYSTVLLYQELCCICLSEKRDVTHA